MVSFPAYIIRLVIRFQIIYLRFTLETRITYYYKKPELELFSCWPFMNRCGLANRVGNRESVSLPNQRLISSARRPNNYLLSEPTIRRGV
jgi:hypothetical protein